MRQRLHLSSGVLAALLVVALAGVGGRADRPRRRHRQGRSRPADQGRDRHGRKSGRVAEQLHGDDRRQGPLLDHRPAHRARGRSPRRRRASAPEPGKLHVPTIGAPNPPLTFTLKKGGARPGRRRARRHGGEGSAGRTRGRRSSSTTAQKWDEAIAAYRAIMAKAPALSVINLQIAAAYRNKKDYDNAIAAYNDLLKADPNNDKAKVGIGMTNLEKGDLKAAEDTLTTAAAGTERRRAKCSTTSAR